MWPLFRRTKHSLVPFFFFFPFSNSLCLCITFSTKTIPKSFAPYSWILCNFCFHVLCMFFLLCLQIFLDANTIRLGNIPLGSAVDPLEGAPAGTTYTKQTVYELCACANGKLYLSPAEKGSTCQTTSNFCLWSWGRNTHGTYGRLSLKLI